MDTGVARERSAEAAEAQIERFITQRDERRRLSEGERAEHELWQESVARYNALQEAEMRAQWYGWHCDQAERHRRTLEALIAHHESEAERLCQENGNGHHKKGEA